MSYKMKLWNVLINVRNLIKNGSTYRSIAQVAHFAMEQCRLSNSGGYITLGCVIEKWLCIRCLPIVYAVLTTHCPWHCKKNTHNKMQINDFTFIFF